MGGLIESYTELLERLLPRGRAWAQGADSRLRQLLSGIAAELARVDERAQDLLGESYPGTTDELLVDWERVTGLPDPCVGELEDLAQRRAAVLARLGTLAEQRPAFYVAFAATLGFNVTIREYQTAYCGTAVCTDPMGAGWANAWTVVVDGSYEGSQGRLECALARIKPAHTVLTFEYEPLCLEIIDSLGNLGHIHQTGAGIEILSDAAPFPIPAVAFLSATGLDQVLLAAEGLVVVDAEGAEGIVDLVEGALPFTAADGTNGSLDLTAEILTIGLSIGSLSTAGGLVELTLAQGQKRHIPLVDCPVQPLRELYIVSADGEVGVLTLDAGGVPLSTAEGTGARIVNVGASIPFDEADGTEAEIELGPAQLEQVKLNVITFLCDDAGLDAFRIYKYQNAWIEGFDYANTPHLDALAEAGVVFDGFYAAPVCSPLRTSLLTGKRVVEHRLGFAVNAGASHTLADVPGFTLPEILNEVGVLTAAVGKYHLARGEDEPMSPRTDAGFHTYSGKLENAGVGVDIGGLNQTWERYTYAEIDEEGNLTLSEHIGDHLQIRAYNDARARLTELRSSGDPWFLYVPFYLSHGTYAPAQGAWIAPDVLDPVSGEPYHTRGDWATYPALEAYDVFRQMLEAMDTMVGGILAQLTPEELEVTVVIFATDNGTDSPVMSSSLNPSLPPQHGGRYVDNTYKRTVREGGVRCPLIVKGGAKTGIVGGRTVQALAEGNDLFATIAEAFGAPVPDPPEESRSLWPILRDEQATVRTYATAQRHEPLGAQPIDYTTHQVCVVGDGWKLIEKRLEGEAATRELYHLSTDRWELTDRIEEALVFPATPAGKAYLALLAELNRIYERASLSPVLELAEAGGALAEIPVRTEGLPLTDGLGAPGHILSDGTTIEIVDATGSLGELTLLLIDTTPAP